MDFEKYYFSEEYDNGEQLTKLVHKTLGGGVIPQHRMKLDDPMHDGRDKNRNNDSNMSHNNSQEPSSDDTNKPTSDDDEIKEPKPRSKEIPIRNKFGGHGYMNDETHELYNDLVSKIIDNPEFKDNIVKTNKTNQDEMNGYKIVFKPVGEDPDLPDYNRTMYVFKNKSKKGNKGHDWTSIAFRGRDSFKDALKLFFPQMLKDKEKLQDLAHSVKWHQAQPSQISNPTKYADWKNNEIPSEDVEFTTNVIKDVLNDERNKSESFNDYYTYDMLIESLNEDENNLIDKAIMNTFKGIGGGLAGLIKKPPIKKLGNPGQITKFFPSNSTYRIIKPVYDNVKTFCTKSIAEWAKVKETHGVIAQQFVKAKSVYVDKTFEVQIKTPNPKNEKKMEEFEKGFSDLIKAFDIDTVQYDFMVQDVQVYHTTNGGYISVMMISLEKKDEEDETTENNPNEAVDMTNLKELEYQYFLGVDNKGKEFFTSVLNTDIKNFVQRYSNPTAAKKGVAQMDSKYGGVLNEFMKGKKMIMKRKNIPNKEFNNILKSFDEYAKGKTKSDKQFEKNGMNVHQYILNNGGKVMFVNDGEGTDGRIIISLNAINDFKKSKADDISKYDKVSLKDEK